MRFETLFFDFDSTIVNTETFELLAEEALRDNPNAPEILKEFQKITNQGMNGEILLEEGFRLRMALVSLNRGHIEAVRALMQDKLSPSIAADAAFFTEHADRCYIVSGGFSDLIFPVSDHLGIARDHVFANQFLFNEQGAVIGLDTTRPTCRAGGKAAQILALGTPRPAVMIGDGMTDYEAKHRGGVDTFIAYTEFIAREKVCAVADACVASFSELQVLLK